MNELRSPLEDRPYRPAARPERVEVMSTGDFYRNKWLAIRYSRWFPMVSVIAGIALFGVIISYAYREGTQVGDNATTPVVQAEGGEYKEKPADPGGMDVPFQDAVVFDQLQSTDAAKTAEGEKVENLLAPPEQPVAATTEAVKPETPVDATTPPVVPANDNAKEAAKEPVKDTEAAPVATTESKVEEATEATTPPAAAPAVEETVVKPVEEAKPVAEVKPVMETPAVTTEKPLTMDSIVQETVAPKETAPAAMPAATAPMTPPAATAPMATQSGDWRVQLGSFRDEAAAHAAWSKFQQKHPAELGSLTAAFPRADIPGKGVFYRVQGTSLAKDSATAICKQLNAEMPGSCIVTK